MWGLNTANAREPTHCLFRVFQKRAYKVPISIQVMISIRSPEKLSWEAFSLSGHISLLKSLKLKRATGHCEGVLRTACGARKPGHLPNSWKESATKRQQWPPSLTGISESQKDSKHEFYTRCHFSIMPHNTSLHSTELIQPSMFQATASHLHHSQPLLLPGHYLKHCSMA